MVSTVKYPSFKQIGLSKRLIWVTPIIIIGAASVAVFYPGWVSKLLFIPLLLYALIGLRKNTEILSRLATRRLRFRGVRVKKPLPARRKKTIRVLFRRFPGSKEAPERNE